MSAEVDHAIIEGEGSAPADKGHRRKSSASSNALSQQDLENGSITIKLAKEVSKLGWKINTSPTTIGEPDTLKKPFTTPLIKKVDLKFKTGLVVTARNLKGVTIKDVLDAIHKQFKKRADDELPEPYLEGFIYDVADYGYGGLGVSLTDKQPSGGSSGKKSKNKKQDE